MNAFSGGTIMGVLSDSLTNVAFPKTNARFLKINLFRSTFGERREEILFSI
jgi:hypothetical protein